MKDTCKQAIFRKDIEKSQESCRFLESGDQDKRRSFSTEDAHEENNNILLPAKHWGPSGKIDHIKFNSEVKLINCF